MTTGFARAVTDALVAFRDSDAQTTALATPVRSNHEYQYACQVGVKLGLRVGRTPALTFVQPYDPTRREVLIQLVHTPKCGGRYFKHHLGTIAAPIPPNERGVFPRAFRVRSPTHRCTYVFINGHLPARNFRPGALRVGFVREPCDRMRSTFSYLCYGGVDTAADGTERAADDWETKWRKRLRQYTSLRALLTDAPVVRELLDRHKGKEHFFPMTYWLCDDARRPLVDVVLRQSDLTRDTQRFCRLLGIPTPASDKPRINVTTAKVSAAADDAAYVRRWWGEDLVLYKALLADREAGWRRAGRRVRAARQRLGGCA